MESERNERFPIVRSTPPCRSLGELHFPFGLDDELTPRLRAVLDGSVPELEFAAPGEREVCLRIRPYRGLDRTIAGAMVSVTTDVFRKTG